MNALMVWLTFLTGVTLRLGVPLMATALGVWLLRQLDRRWQIEARAAQREARWALTATQVVPCWVSRNCPIERRALCAAFVRRDLPCWQLFRDERGHLKPLCLGCEVFRNAPMLSAV
jgi:hypothetical protein